MYTNIIGTQQIVITAAFLGMMVLLLVILRKKSNVIRAGLKAGKRINVVEETAVSPSERLRLVVIDSKEFIMVSAKGHAPSLMPLKAGDTGSDMRENQCDDADAKMEAAIRDAMQARAAATAFDGTREDPQKAQASQSAIDDPQAFAKKFQSWRQQNAGR
jgi:flagellar protein FliO/FliZ